MALSIYQLSVPAFIRGMTALDNILTKAEAHAAETGTDLQDLFEARLAPDMLPLSGQIQRASDTSKLAVARLTGVAAPAFEDNEATFADLHARIAKTVDYFKGVEEAAFEGAETRKIELRTQQTSLDFVGADFLTGFALPNFYFHVTAAYAILRNAGVPVGKRDYLGG
ncbi:DUF1993 domain-containing protein [Caulobacter mirabilis]|uniref:DUF1993 domain-containing protein n=1 Tax=Caulobacter mirabilis TaxID=69666 RepID=A0A2D2B267_9CAUL|nr:DUF1993 domain-containing protein [Caulobacter mirabilis]ATQ44340.1 hypothetical protein CSW64_19080 [Caulobacter mirabilis]